MASLNETGSVVANSLEVVNNEGVGNQDNQPSEQWINGDNQERPVIQKDLNILYDILERVEHKLDKISDIERRLVKIEGLVNRLDTLEGRVAKSEKDLNKAMTCITKTEADLSEAKRAISKLEQEARETDTCIDGYSNMYDGLRDDITSLKTGSHTMKKSVMSTESSVSELMSEVTTSRDELREEILDLKCRSMRDNLFFFGIEEGEEEDCEFVLRTFVSRRMKVRKAISFERVHRVGRKQENQLRPSQENQQRPSQENKQRPRPIVAKFTYFQDRELVRRQAPITLKGSDYWVQEQFPPEVEQRRKALYPIMREERKKKNKVALVKDKLFINGVEYKPPEMNVLSRSNMSPGPSVSHGSNKSPDSRGPKGLNSGPSAGTVKRTTPSQRDRKRQRVGSQ